MRSSNRGRRGRRKRGVPVYLIGGFLALWILVLGGGLYWGGGSEPSGGVSNGAGGSTRDGSPDSGSFAGSSNRPPDDQGQTEDSNNDTTPDESQENSAGQASEPQDVSRNGEKEPKDPDPGTRLPRQSSGGEPLYDPLGKGLGASSLSQTDLERVELAAFRYVDAAYNFEGKGPSKRLNYLGEVGQAVDAPEFWESPESPGSEVPHTVAARINEYGVDNNAAFQSFDVEETSSERVIGAATFTLDEGDGRKTYSQRLVLSRWAAVWRILYAKPLEEIS